MLLQRKNATFEAMKLLNIISMKVKLILITIFAIAFLSGFSQNTNENKPSEQKTKKTDDYLLGKWVRIGHAGPISFDFKENGLVEGDFETIEIVSKYELSDDTIKFIDKEGKMCQTIGQYRIYHTKYYGFDIK